MVTAKVKERQGLCWAWSWADLEVDDAVLPEVEAHTEIRQHRRFLHNEEGEGVRVVAEREQAVGELIWVEDQSEKGRWR